MGDDRVLRISGISGKMAREEDFLGHVTPYLVSIQRLPMESLSVRLRVAAFQPSSISTSWISVVLYN